MHFFPRARSLIVPPSLALLPESNRRTRYSQIVLRETDGLARHVTFYVLVTLRLGKGLVMRLCSIQPS